MGYIKDPEKISESICKKLKEEFGQILLDMARKTWRDHKERGLGVLVSEKGELTRGPVVVGGEAKVKFPKPVPRKGKVIPLEKWERFGIHTHPKGSPLSPDETLQASRLESKICLVRTTGEGDILECFDFSILGKREVRNKYLDFVEEKIWNNPYYKNREKKPRDWAFIWEKAVYPEFKKFVQNIGVKYCKVPLGEKKGYIK